MDFNYSSTECEKSCRDIHRSWNELSRLGAALAHLTRSERRQIKDTYRAMFHDDLVERLHGEHMSNPKNELYKMLYIWMLDPAERDAMLVRDAIERSLVDYQSLVEIYTRRKSDQLFFTKQAYLVKFKRNLDQDISSEPSHPFQRILAALATSRQSHQDNTSQHIAKCDAKRLHEVGKGSTGGVDESVILEIISKRSIPQLRLAFTSYKHIYGREYTKTLKGSCGEFEQSLRLAVKCFYTPAKYYSKIFHTCIEGSTVDKRILSRVIIGSEDVGMGEVKRHYEKTYGKKLKDAICDRIPVGDYRDFIVALITGPVSA
ncbi:annexin D8-like protein [Carex littledalei]|uniref:Annexin D8-like protein n=1 Tax=Carex littledalei TaxID=544730 RepID=A0A833V3L3_9POAL|nr:annexin D8-like protein [Carex littledalei]